MSAIALSAYPADTLTQAAAFYTRPTALYAIRALVPCDGWKVGHNFHFGHFQAGYAWTHGLIAPVAYIDLWSQEIATARAVRREQWAKYFDWLVAVGIALNEDREQFDHDFTETARGTATPRPGLSVSRVWSIEEAEARDSNGHFIPEVRTAYEELRALASA